MSRIDLITSLPTCLSCSVLCEWLGLKSLTQLDSAYCNRNVRSQFLELMRCKECVSCDKVATSTPRLLEWLLVRELQVSRMILNCAHAQLIKYMFRNATAFQELELHEEVLDYFPNLKFKNVIALTCRLYLRSCSIFDKFPMLRKLNVRLRPTFCYNTTTESGILPELDHLSVGCFEPLLCGNILCVVRMAHSLRHLTLQIVQNDISHTEWMSIAKYCPQLLTLSVFIQDLPDATLGEVCCMCPHITTLVISLHGSASITDAGVLFIAQRLLHLQSLILLECQQLTDLSLAHIAMHCKKLRALTLLESPLVTPSALVELQRRLKQKHIA